MSVSDDKDDSSAPAHENQNDANSRAVKTFKNSERGPRSSQSSDYSERTRKFGGDRNQSRGWRGGDRRRYGSGRGGYNDGRRRNFNNNRRYNNDWRNNGRGRDGPSFSETNCYVANLPEEWDDNKLASIFVEFGEIESAAIMHANREDRQRIAFVNFSQKGSAAKAIENLHQKLYKGHPIRERGLIVKKAYLRKYNDRQRDDNNRNSGRFDRNSSHGSMTNSTAFQSNQGHPSNGSNQVNHNKNMHNIKQDTNTRRPHSGPPMRMQNQMSAPPQANQSSFAPNNAESRNSISHNSDTDQLTHQMGSNWGPGSVPERHQRNPLQSRSYQGVQQQQQAPQQQQQFMMHVVPQVPQVAQNYQYMVDQQGNPMQMQMMDQNGAVVPVMFPQHMQQPQMQIVNVPGPNGEWVQQMVPVQQQHQVQHVQSGIPMQQLENQQGNPNIPPQMMHGEMHQSNMMYEVPHDQVNPYAMQHMQQQQRMHHAQSQFTEMQRANSSSQPPPGFQSGHVQHEQMRQMPSQTQYVAEGHQYATSRVNMYPPSSSTSQVYPSVMGLPMHPDSTQTDD